MSPGSSTPAFPPRYWMAVVAVAILSAGGCTGSSGPSRVQTGFESVQPGQSTNAEVLSLMGEPEQKSVHNVAGVEMQVWQFEDAKATYTVTFGSATFAGVGPRVLSKDMDPKPSR